MGWSPLVLQASPGHGLVGAVCRAPPLQQSSAWALPQIFMALPGWDPEPAALPGIFWNLGGDSHAPMALAFCTQAEMVEEFVNHESCQPVSSRGVTTMTPYSGPLELHLGQPGGSVLECREQNQWVRQHMPKSHMLRQTLLGNHSAPGALVLWACEGWTVFQDFWIVLGVIFPLSYSNSGFCRNVWLILWNGVPLVFFFLPHFLILFRMDGLRTFQIFKCCFLFD